MATGTPLKVQSDTITGFKYFKKSYNNKFLILGMKFCSSFTYGLLYKRTTMNVQWDFPKYELGFDHNLANHLVYRGGFSQS